MDIGESLTHKVGPLPVWAYGVIIGGLAVGWMWLHPSDGVDGVAPTSYADDTGSYGGEDALDAMDDSLYTGNNSNDVSDSPTTDTSSQILSNAEWLARGVAYLITRGKGPIAAQNALTRYLQSKSLNKTQKALVNAVITYQGVPPTIPTLNPDGSGNGGNGGNNGSGNGGTRPMPKTNAQWKNMGATLLAKRGRNQKEAHDALMHYINRKALTPKERQMKDSVVAVYGQPPEGRVDKPSSKRLLGGTSASGGSAPSGGRMVLGGPDPSNTGSTGGGANGGVPVPGATSVSNPSPIRQPVVVAGGAHFSSGGGPRVR